jgi:hypothetical protein
MMSAVWRWRNSTRAQLGNLEQALARNAAVRWLGVLCLALGAYLAYLSIYALVAEEAAESRAITVHRLGIGASLGSLFGGIILLIAGRRVRRFMVLRWQDATPQQVRGTLLLATLLAAACIAFETWFARYLQGLGCVVRMLP